MIANKIPRMATSTNDDPGSGPRPETQGRNTCRISEFCSRAMLAALVRGPARYPPQPPNPTGGAVLRSWSRPSGHSDGNHWRTGKMFTFAHTLGTNLGALLVVNWRAS
jgi:hypothetical protein